MNVFRKSLLVQLLLFIVFILMGGYTIVEFYFRAEYPWIGYILLGILLLVAGLGFYLFKKDDKRVCVITEKEMTSIRYLLYGYFIVYVIEMILPSLIKTINLEFLTVTTGVVLILIAIVGTVIQLNILKSSKK
ncbi:MAG: hypothetical protein A2Y45_10155 [Tenericutes bacterium GWC2_34_14]|nr:MAG: hypothetical protein A2Z84_07730 [Tenericutes bacterium GWA2_35_7]OHE28936.1 MAG: hypothetical protein A2Y45_10155 [Tenericutes bacterium GWC2_34_14]OHE33853.1 MAG: hypothetical protein A2012_07055 [Tenericutes bacterium GWE2_34_108]OHE36588.1 MAG: hypothetical protein A2Y46_03865 [Tenericutes bacterium GWF1_35_14]OHE37836.1 MAG: hypothetical protein A2Y44_05415 [Tenericutes bacterium GWF2_35_184]OHE45291.1 MAG: hypothetical protein A2221_07780 [Tenericutes bacterium RIFOXYA2_FULL_36_3